MTATHSPIVELRRYTLNPGMREQLIDVFETHLIEGQERDGMTIIGQFRDLDDPDAFVWLRGFPDMDTRRRALTDFYSGPVWLAHRETANATMITFDDVHLLRPVEAGGGFSLSPRNEETGLITVNLVSVKGDAAAFAAWHAQNMLPLLRAAGSDVIARFVTEPSENTYPALPVHGTPALAMFTRFASVDEFEAFRARLGAMPEWQAAFKAASEMIAGPPRALKLVPTEKSALR